MRLSNRHGMFCFLFLALVTSEGVWSLASSASESTYNQGSVANELVSPILNREIEASVKARWPSSPDSIFCEAFAYHLADDFGGLFLQQLSTLLLERTEEVAFTYESALSLALDASPFDQFSERALLKWFLAMRATSPFCELHRGLFDALCAAVIPGQVLTVLYPSGKALKVEALETSIQEVDDDFDFNSVLVDGETIFPGSGASSNVTTPLVIVYANLGSRAFAEAFQKLSQSSFRFVVRHVSANSNDQEASPFTSLQGYGVSLDIRNVEYKVFDDRSEKERAEDAEYLNVSATNENLVIPSVALAGVNITALQTTWHKSHYSALQKSLLKVHETQQRYSQIVPPVWQRRQLPLQATAVIAASNDPLVTLQDISQNLPSLASTVVHVKIPETLVNQTSGLQRFAGQLYVNGRSVSLEQPSFNVFELMNLLRQEQQALRRIQLNLGPFLNASQLKAVRRAWIMGRDFLSDRPDQLSDIDDEEDSEEAATNVYRVDVGHGWKSAVIYLNDVEKDPQYSRWPTRLDQMMMMMQFGRPPSVRRNLFTFLSVIDPLENPRDVSLSVAFQVLQAQFPARIGIVLVSEAEVRECTKWVSQNAAKEGTPCPVAPILTGKPSLEQLSDIKGTTHALHTIATHFAEVHGNKGDGALAAYMEYMVQFIADKKEQTDGDLSMRDLIAIHGSLMQGMSIVSEKEGEAEAYESLLADRKGDHMFHYGSALRFAVDKALFPGLSFINGRPVPSDESGQSAAETFREEQGYVINLIVTGEITDRAPKSVYAKLLSGSNVYSSFHPLLRESSDVEDKYVEQTHSFGDSSLVSLDDPATSSGPSFVLEATIDYSMKEGIQLAATVVELMESFPTSLKVGAGSEAVRLAYRILPGSAAASRSAFCPLFAHATSIGSNSLKTILKSVVDVSVSSDALLATIPNAGKELAHDFLSTATRKLCLEHGNVAEQGEGNFLTLNGRKFRLDEGIPFNGRTLELLLNLELNRAKAVTKLVGDGSRDAVSKTAAFLAREESLAEGGYSEKRSSSFERIISDEQLRFAWNAESSPKSLLVRPRLSYPVCCPVESDLFPCFHRIATSCGHS